MKYRAWDRLKEKMVPIVRIDFEEWYLVVRDQDTKRMYGDRCSFKNEETDRFFLYEEEPSGLPRLPEES